MKRYILGILLGFLSGPLLAQEVVSDETNVPPVEKISYTWNDFLKGKECLDDFNRLQRSSFLTPAEENLTELFQKYCLKNIEVWENLLDAFYQGKKNLLINNALKEKNLFERYLKVLYTSLFYFHNTKPTGYSLEAKLDQIQNAIQNKNPEGILFLKDALSSNEQTFLMPVFNTAESLIEFQKKLQEAS